MIAVLLESVGPVASPQVDLGLRCDQKWIMTAALSLGMRLDTSIDYTQEGNTVEEDRKAFRTGIKASPFHKKGVFSRVFNHLFYRLSPTYPPSTQRTEMDIWVSAFSTSRLIFAGTHVGLCHIWKEKNNEEKQRGRSSRISLFGIGNFSKGLKRHGWVRDFTRHCGFSRTTKANPAGYVRFKVS